MLLVNAAEGVCLSAPRKWDSIASCTVYHNYRDQLLLFIN